MSSKQPSTVSSIRPGRPDKSNPTSTRQTRAQSTSKEALCPTSSRIRLKYRSVSLDESIEQVFDQGPTIFTTSRRN